LNEAVVHHSKTAQPMSAMGQKRTGRFQFAMSALPPKADIPQHHRDVRFVPILLRKSAMTTLDVG
jgi:hypothetical protein